MLLHEYQTKEIFKKNGIPVPQGEVASTPDEVYAIAQRLGGPCVVKAQIHAGGRGKGGGIRLVKTAEEARSAAQDLLGKPLITPQTGPQGKIVHQLWVEQPSEIEKEYYLGMVMDRAKACPVVIASVAGGMDIEEVASQSPRKILKEPVDPSMGLGDYQGRKLAEKLGFTGSTASQFTSILKALCKTFQASDGSLLEVNPLVKTKSGDLVALDAKFNIDNNALFRQKELAAMQDTREEDPTELEANRAGLSYVKLNGNIGCLVNGAGLAMATMDTIKLYGGEPANFLDVGGGASKEQVSQAFQIILADPNVSAIFVNIFGGILKCDVLAQGIVDAVKEAHIQVPLVVRLEGTHVEKGREILKSSGLKIEPAESMAEGAQKAVSFVAKG
ncbi:MAG: ADP-forming succinate--CoA ligase subunit beta [Deltaproteobacteria bacterium]|nr:ADP-forming succinate--CoA ligase subunit beta [Deltaproteobacteria bacterium]